MSTDTESRGSPTQKEKDPLADCPMPRLSALTPVKAGLMIKEGHAFRTWKVGYSTCYSSFFLSCSYSSVLANILHLRFLLLVLLFAETLVCS